MPRFRPRLLHFAIKDRMSKVQGFVGLAGICVIGSVSGVRT